MLDLASLTDLLTKPQKIVITTHHKPDGDAMGSSLGLYNYLIQQGHHARVIAPTDYPDFLSWLPGNENVIIYTEHREEAAALIADAKLIFCLDFNALSRINDMGELVGESNAYKIMIDHHLEPADFDDYRHWDINACATAQLVYDFIVNELHHKELVNKNVATCLYTGIMTDSASFRLPNTTSGVHRIVADLIDAGAVNWRIHELVYNSASENRLRFLGHCLANCLEVLPEFNTAIIAVNKHDLERFDVETGDTEGVVNYALSMASIRLAAFIVERSDRVKLSLRSKGEFPANEICKKYFNGGGHRNAAGGHSDGSLEQVIQQFKQILPEYKKLLIQ
ncbi:bifunctional oligoribonuclease/PAP phosphatase NrnA [Mucilaginibacter rubeus]|uniref:Bifunctional oligoribonuclease/PAP phosphatase NrnA n=1 Tax=Mucilaginibacter rubeus TaxID=2027860 RepID=A0AAE6JHZ2_9SPHI|nr:MULTISPECIES: DHH family phosphoesterase [Mucilaginibacter]QEM06042.1 bifunctional oligoribonuclease/PAP phosphatase NrnA [Mucilaginibacter rubeus]QEM18623.1 bifunctional oligoribonuclease/PAP phosphatase NrnA [Mucilaginibacter gossypii]QTE44835.1 DHH family phosphoesterase [Mucilaginibacter rubeus]QTE51433.1 DHH family phosphoesterase [Mucilaginibacter rubeus]QTE56519.1 DHH family phosphoesterase [Mucilaginibacter rubeus]